MIFALIALVVPGLALALPMAIPGGFPWPIMVPFGWPMLMVVQLVCGLPIAWYLAGLFPALPTWVGAGAGLFLALLTHLAGPIVGLFIEEAGFEGRLAIRVVWCLILQLPWAIASAKRSRPRLAEIALAMVLSLAFPCLYGVAMIETFRKNLGRMVEEGRLALAVKPLAALVSVGATMPSGDQAAPVLARFLVEIRRTEGYAIGGDREQKIRALLNLDRNQEAVQLLENRELDQQGLLDLGIALQRLGLYRRSGEALKKALEKAEPERSLLILDLLAHNAHEIGNHTEVEAMFLEALDKMPDQAMYLHLQLGRHYHAGNRFVEALKHLEKAMEFDPERNGRVAAALRRDIMRSTPGCLLWK